MSIFDMSMFRLRPKADERFVISGDKYRFTVLTDRMMRLEYSENGVFEDRATRLAFDRCFDTPDFEHYEEGGMLHIKTAHLHLTYDKKPFSEEGLVITVDTTKTWFFGQTPATMPGTVRTLDAVNGAIPLGPSVLNRKTGIAVLDDSKTLAIEEDGFPVPADADRTDLYFFGYYADYAGAIRDFYKLSAPLPLIPRYALGNWWSRYHKYSAEEYLTLLDKFKEKDLPFSVAVIDMDWHIVQTPDPVRYGSGWTGYTWNKELFPDPEKFMSELHKKGLAVSLNLHPKDGIRAFDDCYEALCRRLGRDPEPYGHIEFDASDPDFMDAYFDTVLNPMEDAGVDFWWIDWQQTGGARAPGYDVLWMLNHCHYTDNKRKNKRPLLFSRYAGIGSHRYPLGFSGDTHITWESLDFQPYFTAMSSNLGFSMWSHDIGGHYQGIRDPELYTRWIQLGVFSPILRLHSSPSDFISKEPWKWGAEAEAAASDFLRLRHKLIPYIYTYHYKNNSEGIPLIRPPYFKHPRTDNAFKYKNEYYFGDELLCMPVTEKRDPDTMLSKATLWLPEGVWIDFFTSRVYTGGRTLDVYRHLDRMPVFARAGSIIPLSADAGCGNPAHIELRVFAGADGSFELIEDNGGDAHENEVSRTSFCFLSDEQSTLRIITPPACSYIPEWRTFTPLFSALDCPVCVTLSVSGTSIPLSYEYDELTKTVKCAPITLGADSSAEIHVLAGGISQHDITKYAEEAVMRAASLSVNESRALFDVLKKNTSVCSRVSEILSRPGNEYLKGYFIELLTAAE